MSTSKFNLIHKHSSPPKLGQFLLLGLESEVFAELCFPSGYSCFQMSLFAKPEIYMAVSLLTKIQFLINWDLWDSRGLVPEATAILPMTHPVILKANQRTLWAKLCRNSERALDGEPFSTTSWSPLLSPQVHLGASLVFSEDLCGHSILFSISN